MSKVNWIVFWAFLLLLVAPASQFQAIAQEKSPSEGVKNWVPGDRWTIAVSKHSQSSDRPEVAKIQYSLVATVTGSDQVKGTNCLKVYFSPGNNVPLHLQDRYYLSVDKSDGSIRQIVGNSGLRPTPPPVLIATVFGHFDQPLAWFMVRNYSNLNKGSLRQASLNTLLDEFEGHSALNTAVDGFPLESIQLFANVEKANAKRAKLQLSVKDLGNGNSQVQSTYTYKNKVIQVRQTWARGQKWWSTYERSVDGNLELSAELVGKDRLLVAQPPSSFPLRLDPKLSVFIKPDGSVVKLKDLIKSVQTHTGLTLTLDSKLQNRHDPVLGMLESGKSGFRAWQLMELLEKKDLKDGQWTKTKDGYHLTGVSTVPLEAPPPPTRPVVNLADEGARRWMTNRVLLSSLIVLLLVAGACGGLYYWKKAKVASEPKNKATQ